MKIIVETIEDVAAKVKLDCSTLEYLTINNALVQAKDKAVNDSDVLRLIQMLDAKPEFREVEALRQQATSIKSE